MSAIIIQRLHVSVARGDNSTLRNGDKTDSGESCAVAGTAFPFPWRTGPFSFLGFLIRLAHDRLDREGAKVHNHQYRSPKQIDRQRHCFRSTETSLCCPEIENETVIRRARIEVDLTTQLEMRIGRKGIITTIEVSRVELPMYRDITIARI